MRAEARAEERPARWSEAREGSTDSTPYAFPLSGTSVRGNVRVSTSVETGASCSSARIISSSNRCRSGSAVRSKQLPLGRGDAPLACLKFRRLLRVLASGEQRQY
jgi:hypothetical protein